MGFFKNITSAMTDAKDYVVEKNKRSSLVGKLKASIKTEKSRADKAYIALGRYYFHNLRDEANADTEPFCVEISQAEMRIERAAMHLERIYKEDIVTPKEEVKEEESKVNIDKEMFINQTPDGVIDEAGLPQEEEEI